MAPTADPRPEPPTHELHVHAMDDLRYIRRTVERAGRFTAVSGTGTIAVGATALAAAAIARAQPDVRGWLVAWIVEAAVAAAIGTWATVRKARRLGSPIASGPGRKFVLGLVPAFAAGALLTAALVAHDAVAVVPGTWLLLYGTGVVAAGAFSVPAVPLQGLAFLAAGAVALLAPAAGDLLLVLGFGGIHLVFGAVIARRHGG